MFFAELTQVLRRRWYLLVVGALSTAAAGFLTFQAVPPSYSSSAEVLLLPPGPSVPDGGNPYLSLSGLTPAGDVLARALSDPKTADEVFAAGGRGEYTVVLDGDSPAPMVSVATEAETASDAMTTRDLVLDRLPATLREIQAAANVPGDAYITTSEVTRTIEPVKEIKPQIRALVVVVGGALVLTLLGTATVDALLRRRSARRVASDAEYRTELPRPSPAPAAEPATTAPPREVAGNGQPDQEAPAKRNVTADHRVR